MKDITSVQFIIPNKLAAFIYKGDMDINILNILLSTWRNVDDLFQFYETNKRIIANSTISSIFYSWENFSEDIMLDLEQLEDFIDDVANGKVNLDNAFHPLSRKEENVKILSLRKHRCKWLRIYAVRIDENLYVITGGAIKITQKMQDHIDTRYELTQLDYSRQWLKDQGIETDESFYCYFDL